MGTVVLNMTEQQFWKSTPRKLSALSRIHAEVNNPEGVKNSQKGMAFKSNKFKNVQKGFIDQVW